MVLVAPAIGKDDAIMEVDRYKKAGVFLYIYQSSHTDSALWCCSSTCKTSRIGSSNGRWCEIGWGKSWRAGDNGKERMSESGFDFFSFRRTQSLQLFFSPHFSRTTTLSQHHLRHHIRLENTRELQQSLPSPKSAHGSAQNALFTETLTDSAGKMAVLLYIDTQSCNSAPWEGPKH